MSTGLIIAIVVVALLLIGFFVLLPRIRAKSREKARERELKQRRQEVAGEHRSEADTRAREAERAERQARIAQKQAEAERAEAELHQERAAMHEKGMADHELIRDDERDRFAGTSAMGPDDGRDRDLDRDRDVDRDEDRDRETQPGARSEFEQGREVGHEEASSGRFQRETPDRSPDRQP
jgi:hypothetical protein